MVSYIDVETFDIEKFGDSIAKAAREAVKWERRKLEWILEEKKSSNPKIKKRLLESSNFDDYCRFEWVRKEHPYIFSTR